MSQRPKGGKSSRQRICFMKASLSLAKLALSRRLTRRIPEVESGDPKIIPKISLFFVMFDGEPIVLGSFMFRKPPGVHEICWRCWKRGRLQTRWDPDLLFRLFFSIFSGSLLCLTSPKRTKTRGLPNEIGPSNPAKPAHLPFFWVWRDMIWHVHDMFMTCSYMFYVCLTPPLPMWPHETSGCAEADFLGAPEESRSSFDVGLLGGPEKRGCKICSMKNYYATIQLWDAVWRTNTTTNKSGTSPTVQRWYEDRRYQDILGMFSPGSLPEAGFNRTEVSPMWRESYVQVDPHMCCWANKRCRIMISYRSPTHFDWIPLSKGAIPLIAILVTKGNLTCKCLQRSDGATPSGQRLFQVCYMGESSHWDGWKVCNCNFGGKG